MTLNKRLTSVLLCGGLAAGAIGAASTGSLAGASKAPKEKSGTYQLGATSDLTGPLSSLGVPWANGLQAYFSWVNSHGGIDGHRVKLTVLDDGSNATTGTSNVRQFISGNDTGMFVYSSFVAVAAAPLIGHHSTPAFLLAPTAGELNPAKPELFSAGMALSGEAQPMMTLGKKLLKKKKDPKLAVIAEQSPILAKLDTRIVDLAKYKRWKMNVVSNQVVPTDASNASAQATAVAGSQPDLVILELANPLAISAVTTLRQQGVTAPIISYPGGAALSTITHLKDSKYYGLNGATPPNPSPKDGPAMAEFFKATKAAHIDPTQSNVLNGFTDAYLMGLGLAKCGYPCNGRQLTKALDGLGHVNMHGLARGTWVYRKKDHTGTYYTVVFHWSAHKHGIQVVKG